MMKGAVGEAPGKILLMGEHSVVYGHPAIAIPVRSVCARAEVVFTRNGGIEMLAPDIGEHVRGGENGASRLAPLVRLAEAMLKFFGEVDQGLRISLHSTIPIGRGMGSGAALAVAIVRSICGALDRHLNWEQIAEWTMISEREYHGTPSGVDSAVVARDEAIYFVRNKTMQPVVVGPSVYHFVIADTGIESATGEVVKSVREAREHERAKYDSFFWELGSMTSMAREVIRTGALEELALCMNHAHKVLQSLGVSCPELDNLVQVSLENGALGAKLSGAGRGGAMLALLKDAGDAAALESRLRAAGAVDVFTTVLGNRKPVGSENAKL